jgi:hypothetical protein
LSQLKRSFPDFVIIDANLDVGQLQDYSSIFRDKFTQLQSKVKSSKGKKYIQVFSAFPEYLCQTASDMENFLEKSNVSASSHNDDEIDNEDLDDGNEYSVSQEASDNDRHDGNDSDGDVVRETRDLDKLLKLRALDVFVDLNNPIGNPATKLAPKIPRRVKKDLDYEFIDFTSFPTDFVVFAAQRCDGDKAITKLSLTLDSGRIPVSKILTGQEHSSNKDMQLTTLAFTPVAMACQLQSQRITLLDSCTQVLFNHSVVLDRLLRALQHINDLKATELQNQPERSILHSDTLFFHCFDALSLMLAQPATCCVGLHNVDLIVSSHN